MDEELLLNEREHGVLETVVRHYILNAEPTGSRFVSRQGGFDLSPASIRNIMFDLEEKGFIAQPHTSAGRVPTDKGYRYYVNRLMKLIELPAETRTQIRSLLTAVEPGDLHLVMETASRALSRATNQLGIILSPQLKTAIFRHVDIFPIAHNRFQMNLTVDSGFVKTMVIEMETAADSTRFDTACAHINQRFYGKTLADMCTGEVEGFGDLHEVELGVIRLLVPSIKRMIVENNRAEVYAEGTANIMLQPEFFNREQVSAVFELLEEKQMLMHLFETHETESGTVVISIGGENVDGQLKSFSVVKTNYRVGNMEGSLGVIGPTRMPYPMLVSAVDYTAKVLGELYSQS